MQLQDWIIYGGCALVGTIFGGGSCLGGVWLYGQLDEIRHWSKAQDALSKAAIYVGAVALGGAAGAGYGFESATMGNSWIIGALWGGGGGILGCAGLFTRVQSAAAGLLERKAGSL